MRHLARLLFVMLLCTSCQKEDFIYSYPETDKLLVSVKHTSRESEYVTEFKYDSLNRIVEIQTFYQGESSRLESFVYDEDSRINEKKSGNFTDSFKYGTDGKLMEKNARYTPADGYNWNMKTKYKYRNGRLNRGIVYSRIYEGIENQDEANEESYISYKYDANGNILEQKSGNNNVKFKYDTKINPLASFGIQTIAGFWFTFLPDVKQVNNPVYTYSYNMAMSSFPPEYEISYEYDSEGLPLRAEIKKLHSHFDETGFVEYVYKAKE